MKNKQRIMKGFLLLAFLVGAVIATNVQADNNSEGASANGFLNAQASLKADAFMKLDSSAVGVVMGANNSVRVLGAKVVSVSGNDISVTASFGNSVLNFVVKTSAETKLNGKLLTDASVLSGLKAGDKLSFAGTIDSSTSSSIVVKASNVVSQTLFGDKKVEDRTSFEGKIQTINTADNSLTIKLKNGVSVKVVDSSSTIVTLDGAASTLASLQAGDEVKVSGTINADGTVITASKISAHTDSNDEDNGTVGKDKEREDHGSNGELGFWGKIRNWFWK